MSSVCPFAKTNSAGDGCPMKFDRNHDRHKDGEEKTDGKDSDPAILSSKCPFGYDSNNFKSGPLSCVICKALLYESSKCLPCSHKYCKACIERFKDCPVCGADIEGIEPDVDLQALVDRFIDGHARIKRSQLNADEKDINQQKTVIYEDVSMARGAFLVQQAMRAFNAKNIGSAISRLSICVEDIREQMESSGPTAELCSQLGAVLGVLGDCCREKGDNASAVGYYEESVGFLSKLPSKDMELIHTLSVSLNKIGDLKYYDGDLKCARAYYVSSLDVRRDAIKEYSNSTSQVVDLAVSLAKVADVDRGLGNEAAAIDGFREAVTRLELLKLDTEKEAILERRRLSVLKFVRNQLDEQQKPELELAP